MTTSFAPLFLASAMNGQWCNVADVSNAIWGFANLAVGLILLWFFAPQDSAAGWILVALGVLLAAVWLSIHFGRVRLQHAGKFSDHRQCRSVLREGVLE
jgi:hypothetical protein